MTCLIFDLDGTLIDSEPLGNQAFLDLLPDLDDTLAGLTLRYKGQRMQDVLDDLSRRLGRPLGDAFRSEHLARLTSLYDTHLVAMPGAAELLASLALPMCVASNGPIAKMHHGLKVTGLNRFLGANVFSAYQIDRWKPDPALFRHAAKHMGHAPEACLVIEDSEAGIAAGVAAGMRVVRYAPGEAADGDPRLFATISHLGELHAVLRHFERAA
jgi:HAD superfamily hydrolase (TIGR01509 family)